MKNSLETKKHSFIKKIQEIFKDTLDYEKIIFVGWRQKVSLFCKKHGYFTVFPDNCIKGYGCQICAKERLQQKNKEEFFKVSKEVHSNFYSYEKAIYKGSRVKICITCPIHGDFYQAPVNHKQGFGCVKCASITIGKKTASNTEEFIKKAQIIHNNKYDYTLVNYKNSDTKVKIICKEHEEFEQSPRTHLSKHGCPKCNLYQGYSKTEWVKKANTKKESIFYIIQCYNQEENFIKIGITCRSIEKRYPNSSWKYNYNVILEKVSLDSEKIWLLEKDIKNKLKNFSYKPNYSFPGSAVECFSANSLKEIDILSYIKSLNF